MREIEIHDYARKLWDIYGANAIPEVAQKAVQLEAEGQAEQARTWRQIQAALKLMRGPHQS